MQFDQETIALIRERSGSRPETSDDEVLRHVSIAHVNAWLLERAWREQRETGAEILAMVQRTFKALQEAEIRLPLPDA